MSLLGLRWMSPAGSILGWLTERGPCKKWGLRASAQYPPLWVSLYKRTILKKHIWGQKQKGRNQLLNNKWFWLISLYLAPLVNESSSLTILNDRFQPKILKGRAFSDSAVHHVTMGLVKVHVGCGAFESALPTGFQMLQMLPVQGRRFELQIPNRTQRQL